MLKRYFYLTFLLGLLVSCTNPSKSNDLIGHVDSPQYEGRYVRLTELNSISSVVDSALISNSSFRFNLGDSLRLYNLVLTVNANDPFPIILPVVAGEGRVTVYLGNKVVTTGTKSNDTLQDFLLASDHIYEQLLHSNQTREIVISNFKQFLSEQIRLNQTTIVSAYILSVFRSNFTDKEFIDLKSQIPQRYRFILD